MRNSVIAVTALLFAVAVAGTAWQARKAELASRPALECRLDFGNVKTGWLQVATSVAQMARGLAGREDVGPGMLFTWQDEQPRQFWMKGTPTPLSVAFIDSRGSVLQILDMEANTEVIHTSAEPAREAIEMHQGEFARLGIEVGSSISGRECRSIQNTQTE